MSEKEVNIHYLKGKYIQPTWTNMLEEAREWYKEGLKQGKFDSEMEKQQLIDYLEDKIKETKDYAISFGLFIDKDISHEIDIKTNVYQEILDFIKGGKDE